MAKQPADAAADAIDAGAPWPTCPYTRSSTQGRRRRRDGHFDKLLRYHHIPHSVSRCFS